MANIIEITIKGVDKTSKAFKTSEKATKGFKDALSGMVKVAGGAAAVAITLKKAFDIGREGAVILQTAESWEFLLDKVRAAPDLLDQLTAASHGTISSQELMSSTMTLLAGASGELATQLANQTPQLMEIAKAANKLNPALGDTAFMYQSIATGVKRASPMILDNLGLTIRIGKANEKYAKQLGKTVEALTAEEKQLALLNATLEAGDDLIAQVGGTTESATDSFDQLAVIMEEAGDSLKTRLYPILLDAAEALKLVVTWADKLDEAFMEHEERIRKTSDSYQEYRNEMDRAAKAMHHWTITTDEFTEAQKRGGIAAHLSERAIVVLTEAAWEADHATKAQVESMREWRSSVLNVKDAVVDLDEEIKTLTEREYLLAAAEALIAGDLALAQHFTDLAREAELTSERIQAIIASLDALDGKKVTFDILRRTTAEWGPGAGMGIQPPTRPGPVAGTVTFRGQTFTNAYWVGDTLMVRGQVYGTFPGRRQYGGPVSANMPYLVGEQGPELFIPRQSGQIEPADTGEGLGGLIFNFYDTVIRDDQDIRNLAYEVVELLKG